MHLNELVPDTDQQFRATLHYMATPDMMCILDIWSRCEKKQNNNIYMVQDWHVSTLKRKEKIAQALTYIISNYI